MFPFLLRLVEFVRSVLRLWKNDPDFHALGILVFVTLFSGTIFYSLAEGWSLVDAFYFSVTTLTTVGFGDLSPTTTIGKLFTVLYIFTGLGIIAGFITKVGTETLSRRTKRHHRTDADQGDSEAT